MKYTIIHSCGHGSEKDLYGPGVEREHYLDWAKRSLCPTCYRKAQRTQGPAFLIRDGAQGYEVICYQNSYDIREALKERGYTFGEIWGPASGVFNLGEKPHKGWSKIGLGAEDACCEEDWIDQQGWAIDLPSKISGIFSALREGRPDLLRAPAAE